MRTAFGPAETCVVGSGRVALLKIAQRGHAHVAGAGRRRELGADELAAPETQRFIDDLVETMRDANGAGLAAPQVSNPIRVVAIEVRANNPRYPYKPPVPLTIVVVTSVIEPLTDETFENYEGCLSVPNLRGVVPRRARGPGDSASIATGSGSSASARGLTAGTFQHECDHWPLDGVLFLDRVSGSAHAHHVGRVRPLPRKDAFIARIKAFIETDGRVGGSGGRDAAEHGSRAPRALSARGDAARRMRRRGSAACPRGAGRVREPRSPVHRGGGAPHPALHERRARLAPPVHRRRRDLGRRRVVARDVDREGGSLPRSGAVGLQLGGAPELVQRPEDDRALGRRQL